MRIGASTRNAHSEPMRIRFAFSQTTSSPLFTRAPRSGFEPGYESRSTGINPSCVHTGGKFVAVNDCIPEGICINNDIATLAYKVRSKMVAAAMIVIIFCFGLASMVWLRQRRRIRHRRRRKRVLARRIRSESFYQTQEEELGAVVWALATDLLMMTTVQRRSVWCAKEAKHLTNSYRNSFVSRSVHYLPFRHIFTLTIPYDIYKRIANPTRHQDRRSRFRSGSNPN